MVESDTWQDYKLPKLETFPPLQRYSQLEGIIAKVDQDGVFPALPTAERDIRTVELNASRTRTVRTRLYLLGYLKKDNESGLVDSKLKQAIQQFQREAELDPCGHVDGDTWTALQEMVGFECPSNLEEWASAAAGGGIKPYRALMRAIKLRLFALGLLEYKQTKKQEKVSKALEKFRLIAQILRLTDEPLSAAPLSDDATAPVYAAATLAALFDQDNIADRLAKAGDSFTIHRPEHIARGKAQKTIKKFVICCAKIELWLLGYDVKLNGKSRYVIPTANRPYAPASYPFYFTLFQFWYDSGKRKKEARNLATGITGAFFRTLREIQQEGEKETETSESDELYNRLAEEPPEAQDKVLGFIKTIGSRIWDGLKRAWRWFKSLIKKVVKKVTTWIKNLARLAYRYAMNAFPTVKQIIKTFSVSVSFLTHRTFPGSDVGQVAINRDKDFDYRLYINPDCDWATVRDLMNRFRRNARVFKTGARIAGMLIDILISVVKNVARGGGWLGVILALVKIYSKLKKLKLVLHENEAFLALV